MTGNTVLFTVAALIGQALTPDKSLTTLPLALLQLAAMAATIPASFLMQRWGRQLGFMLGVAIGIGGAALGIGAILTANFYLFCVATILFGGFNGFAGFYRFAAAEVATDALRAQAIALVMAGGVVAAILGPQLAAWSKDWLPTGEFAGALAIIMVLQLVSLVLLAQASLPRPLVEERHATGRSLAAIARQPMFLVAVLGSMLGYGVMVLIMTATPLSMVANAHPFHAAATVMQWHVLGMFAPSFFTGALIARWGVLRIISLGSVLSLLCIGINLLSSGFISFVIALALLGIGWNFLFIGSTTLLTETYTSVEKAKTQALHDFMMLGFIAFTTVLSGSVFQQLGWQAVNLLGIPMMLVVLGAIAWLQVAVVGKQATP